MCNPSQIPDIELGSTTSDCSELSTSHSLLKGQSPSSSSSVGSSSSSKRRINHDTMPTTPNADTGLGSAMLDSLPPTQQMILLSFLMFLFFGMHNILQEAIANLLANHAELKSNSTFMLGYAEVVGVLGFSYMERTHFSSEGGLARKAPLRAYPLLTACLFASSSLSNLSLSYINFPTKVVFRSCKLVPTMVIATIVNQRVFKSYEYFCALSICAGLVLFAMGDFTLDPFQFEPIGLLFVSLSVVADAILPNAQEHLFKAGSSRLEVTVYSNLFSFLGMTVITLGNGSLVHFMSGLSRDTTLSMYFAVYTVLSYISISCYMTLVKRFGGVTAVVLTTARKAMTLVLSFMLFPKGFSWLYVYGSMLVLGAVMVASICKKMAMKNSEPNKPQQQGRDEYSLKYRSVNTTENNRGDSSRTDDTRSSSKSRGQSTGGSQLESSAEAILEGISKKAYI